MRSKPTEVNARILIFAQLWRNGGAYGVITGDQAALFAGCSRPLVDAARIIIESKDKSLIDAVLAGRVTLTAAAAAFRRRVRLVESYRKASLADRVAFAQAIGPTELFDTTITPALAEPTTPTVSATKTITIKSNGKTANGNGSHPVRPVAPPVIVNVSTH